MSLYIGNQKIGSLYLGSTKIKEAWVGDVKVFGSSVDPYNPLNLPPYTIRCKFSSGYTPTMGDTNTLVDAAENIWDITKTPTAQITGWRSLFAYNNNLLEVLGANSRGPLFDGFIMTLMFYACQSLTRVMPFYTCSGDCRYMFEACSSITEISGFKFRGRLDGAFANCTSLTTLNIDTSDVTRMEDTFNRCTSLVNPPSIDTSEVTVASSMFTDCTSLSRISLFDTSKMYSVGYMFVNCTNVQSGALALYQQMSSQANPPNSHISTFYNCGINTETGLAELQQIPQSWGGLAPG
jgi:hypothetical protein